MWVARTGRHRRRRSAARDSKLLLYCVSNSVGSFYVSNSVAMFSVEMRGAKTICETEPAEVASVLVLLTNTGKEWRREVHDWARIPLPPSSDFDGAGHIWCDHGDHSNGGRRRVFDPEQRAFIVPE